MKQLYFFFVIFFIVCFLYSWLGQKLRNKEKREFERIYFNQSYWNKRFFSKGYEFFSSFFLTRSYIQKIKKRMEVYSPGKEEIAKERTIQIFLASIFAGGMLLSILILLKPQWVLFFVFISGIYFSNSMILNHAVEKEEVELLRHLLSFLSDIRHAYQESGMIEESIANSIHERTPEDMRLHGTCILKVLSSEDTQEELKRYFNQISNIYLKELITLCVTVLWFGDQSIQGKSLFLTNICHLKQAVNTELLRRKKQKHLFGGYSFILVFPIFSLPFISLWAQKTMPSLSKYYNGIFGIFVPATAFFITFTLYQMNIKLQQTYFYEERVHSVFFYLCEKEKIRIILNRILSRNAGKRMRMERLLKEAGDSISVYEFLLRRVVIAMGSFLFFESLFLFSKGTFPWYSLFLSIGVAYLASYYPVWLMHYDCFLIKRARMDEVMQFQSVIYMLSPIPQMTSELLLSCLEHFAKIFRSSIAKCIDYISASEEVAFEKLQEEETYEPFQRLIENLKACDRVGVLAAFDELGVERTYFGEERRQKEDIELENKAAVGSFISMIPTFFIVIGYLILPFVMESFSLFSMQLKQINF